jgi:hypothetical protein
MTFVRSVLERGVDQRWLETTLCAMRMPHNSEVLAKDDQTFLKSRRLLRTFRLLLRFEPVASDSQIDDKGHRQLRRLLHLLFDQR